MKLTGARKGSLGAGAGVGAGAGFVGAEIDGDDTTGLGVG